MKNNTLLRILIVLAIYIALKYFGGDYGQKILYPITLLVTFLHELGHALGALLTGGEVVSVNINPDGSGQTLTRGGMRSIILMGGYIGSAILGNLMFFVGARKEQLSQIALNLLAIVMVLVGFIWYDSMYTTGFLLLFAVALLFIANKTRLDREVMMFLGLASLFHIVQDFRVGPSSDLEQYAALFVIVPKTVWMYIWLGIVVLLCMVNLQMIVKGIRNQ